MEFKSLLDAAWSWLIWLALGILSCNASNDQAVSSTFSLLHAGCQRFDPVHPTAETQGLNLGRWTFESELEFTPKFTFPPE